MMIQALEMLQLCYLELTNQHYLKLTLLECSNLLPRCVSQGEHIYIREALKIFKDNVLFGV
jgi:hypothetical protein